MEGGRHRLITNKMDKRWGDGKIDGLSDKE